MALDQLHEHERFEKEKGEMSFFEHIDELRKHVLRSVAAIFIVGIVCFLNKDIVFNKIIFGPRDPNFPTFKALCWLSRNTGLGENLCITPTPFKVITRDLGEVLMQHLMVSFWMGLIVAFPYVFYEFWKFLSPGLHDKERKAVRGVVFVCSILFLVGVLFGYFIIAPFSISFLAGYTLEGTEVTATLDSYVNYMTMFTLPTGLVFEMPIVAYFLATIGILGSKFLRTYRRYAIVIIFIVAAIITPPDVASQTIVSIPLLLLYEVSIWVVVREEKKRQKLSDSRDLELK